VLGDGRSVASIRVPLHTELTCVSTRSSVLLVALVTTQCGCALFAECTTLTVVYEESKLEDSHLHFLFVFHSNTA
jgi:hypothetical protein